MERSVNSSPPEVTTLKLIERDPVKTVEMPTLVLAGPILHNGYKRSFEGPNGKCYSLPLSNEDSTFLSAFGNDGKAKPLGYRMLPMSLNDLTKIELKFVIDPEQNYLMYTNEDFVDSTDDNLCADLSKLSTKEEKAVVSYLKEGGDFDSEFEVLKGPILKDGYPTQFEGPEGKIYNLPLSEEENVFLSKVDEDDVKKPDLRYLASGLTEDLTKIEITFVTFGLGNYILYRGADFLREIDDD